MARQLLNKRLNEAESKVRRVSRNRNEAEARNVTPARLEEIMLGWDIAHRNGGCDGINAYINSLAAGERIRAYHERGQWVQDQAKLLTPEYLAKLEADGVEIQQWTEAEMTAFLYHFGGENESNIDLRSVPYDVLKSIGDGTCQISNEELSRMYPNRSRK